MSQRDAGWTNATDTEVRALLTRQFEQMRAGDPHAVLGLAQDAGPDAVRRAFLQATKVYHPNRFARRERDIIKLANEVFLLLKDAYRQLTERGATRPSRSTPAHAFPARTAGSSGATPPARASRTTSPRPLQRTPPGGMRSVGRTRSPRTTSPTTPMRAVKPREHIRVPQSPVPVAAPGSRSSRITVPGRPVAPSSTPSPAPRRPGGSSSTTPPPRTTVNIRSRARRTSAPPAVRDYALVECRELCDAGKWREATLLLEGLSQRHPRDREVFAFLHYVAGREQQAGGHLAAARAEFRRALDINPQFDDARQALAALDHPSGHRSG